MPPQNCEKVPPYLALANIWRDKLVGELVVAAPDYHKSIYLKDGQLIFARSTRFEERLIVIMHLLGHLSEVEYNDCLKYMQHGDDEVEQILLSKAYIEMGEMYNTRLFQFRRIASSIFLSRKGSWEFIAGNAPQAGRDTYYIPLPELINEGARHIESVAYFADRHLFAIPRLRPIPDSLRHYLSADTLVFIEALLGLPGQNCRALIAALNIHPHQFWRHMIAFNLLNLVEFLPGEAKADLPPDIANLLALHDRIMRAEGDLPAILGLPAGASQEHIAALCLQWMEKYAPQHFGSALAPEIKRIAKSVQDWLASVLSLDNDSLWTEPLPDEEQPGGDYEKAYALYRRGQEHYEIKQYAEAAILATQALQIDPEQGDFYYLLGLCQSEDALTWASAEENLKQAISLQLWNIDAIAALGVLYQRQRKTQLASKCFARVRELSQPAPRQKATEND